MSNSYRDLIVWQKAVALVTDVYRWTEPFPKHELYGLASQMRRAAVSAAANIAEGQGRNSRGEFLQFLGTSKGSLTELETHIEIATNLHYFSEGLRRDALQQTDEVSRLINGLRLSIEKMPSRSARPTRN